MLFDIIPRILFWGVYKNKWENVRPRCKRLKFSGVNRVCGCILNIKCYLKKISKDFTIYITNKNRPQKKRKKVFFASEQLYKINRTLTKRTKIR